MKNLLTSIVILLSMPSAAEDPKVFTMKDAWTHSLRHSDDLEVARTRLDRAKAGRRKVLSGLLPSITTSATYTLNDREVKVGDRVVVRRHDIRSRGQVRMTLIDARALPAYGSASQTVEAERDRLVDVQQSLLLEVSSAYFAALAAKRLLDVAAHSVKAHQQHLDAAKARKVAGHAVTLDVQRAEAALYRAQKEQIEAQEQQDRARDALALVAGLEPPLTLTLERPVLDPMPTVDETQALTRAQAERADIKALGAELEIAERNRFASWMSLLPTVDVTGNVDVTQEGFSNPDGGITKTLLVQLTWSLYDGGMRYAQLDEDAAMIRRARAQLRKRQRHLRGDVRTALRALSTTKARLAVTDAESEASGRALASANAMFKSGTATGLEVLEAEAAFIAAKVAHIREELERDLAQLSLQRAMGALKTQ